MLFILLLSQSIIEQMFALPKSYINMYLLNDGAKRNRLPYFFAFFGAKIGALSITYNKGALPNFFVFFGAKIGTLSITHYTGIFPNIFVLF